MLIKKSFINNIMQISIEEIISLLRNRKIRKKAKYFFWVILISFSTSFHENQMNTHNKFNRFATIF